VTHARAERQFFGAQSVDGLPCIDLELFPISGGKVRRQIQDGPWLERSAIDLGTNIKATTDACEAACGRERVKRPAIIYDSNPVREHQRNRRDQLKSSQQFWPTPTALRFNIEVKDILEFIQVGRKLIPARKRSFTEAVKLKEALRSGPARRLTSRRRPARFPTAPAQLTDLRLIRHGLDDKPA
jgi:hypothetical protein